LRDARKKKGRKNMKQLSKNQDLLSSVGNALRMLRSFSFEQPEMGVTELANFMGIGKSTAQRLINTLVSEGFLRKKPNSQRYRLGLSVLALSGIISSSEEIFEEALPSLRRLVANTGETGHIAVVDNLEVVYLLKVDSSHPVRFLTHVGKRNPLHATSTGKVILAYQKDEHLFESVIQARPKRFTPSTITDPNQLRNQLQMIRKMGYAYSVNELLEGVVSVAAPIFDYRGEVTAAVNIVGPIQRIEQMRIPYFAKKIIEAGKEISNKMGYYNGSTF
jgi:IclR family KDG regulon transcriptional repressor